MQAKLQVDQIEIILSTKAYSKLENIVAVCDSAFFRRKHPLPPNIAKTNLAV